MRICTIWCCQTWKAHCLYRRPQARGDRRGLSLRSARQLPHGGKIWPQIRSVMQTKLLSDRLVRLPLWLGLEEYQSEVIQHIVAEL